MFFPTILCDVYHRHWAFVGAVGLLCMLNHSLSQEKSWQAAVISGR
jgi:hypothetical protein